MHGSIVVFRGLHGPHEKEEIVDLTHVHGMNAHAQKKGCIRNRLKFAIAAAFWQYSFVALF